MLNKSSQNQPNRRPLAAGFNKDGVWTIVWCDRTDRVSVETYDVCIGRPELRN